MIYVNTFWCQILTYSSEADLKCFNRSVNSLLNVINGPNEIIQMHLLYANCVPIMTYASGIKEFPAREMTNCNTALNNAVRKIFSYNRWESIRTLRESMSHKSLIELFAESRRKFFMSLPDHHSPTLRFLSHLNLFIEHWISPIVIKPFHFCISCCSWRLKLCMPLSY